MITTTNLIFGQNTSIRSYAIVGYTYLSMIIIPIRRTQIYNLVYLQLSFFALSTAIFNLSKNYLFSVDKAEKTLYTTIGVYNAALRF